MAGTLSQEDRDAIKAILNHAWPEGDVFNMDRDTFLFTLEQVALHTQQAVKNAVEAAAEIAFREVAARSGGVAARSVMRAIRSGHTDITDDDIPGQTREEPV